MYILNCQYANSQLKKSYRMMHRCFVASVPMKSELLILAVGVLLVNLSFHLHDLVGSCISLYLLPLAGAESAVALALFLSIKRNWSLFDILGFSYGRVSY